MRILIAEDEVELAGALKFLLEKNRFSVDVAHDGEEALERFRSAAYDVVVLDIMMPGADGMEVLARIRGSGSAVPVLMLTARGGIEERVAGLEAGADDYLPKLEDAQCRAALQVCPVKSLEVALKRHHAASRHYIFGSNRAQFLGQHLFQALESLGHHFKFLFHR